MKQDDGAGAVDRLRSVATAATTSDSWQAARAAVGDYLEGFSSDLPLLAAAGLTLEVDAALQLVAAASGCRQIAKAMKQQLQAQRQKQKAPRLVKRAAESITLADLLPEGAPGPVQQLVMPEGYLLTPEGVAGPPRADTDERPLISARPIYLAAIVRSVDDGEWLADVVWQTPDRQWVCATFPRQVLADGRRIVSLARAGAPVDSGTASMLVRYLSAFEKQNGQALPCVMASSVMGWQGEAGALGFLWGADCLGTDAPVRLLAEAGKQQLASAYSCSGTLAEWRADVWQHVQAHPRVALAVYASLAPVLLGVVPAAPGFVVDWSGRSTGGKTTTLRVAASVWGDPARLIKSWSATQNAIEHLASFSGFLPTFLDDTKEARNSPQKVIGAVYQVTGLQSKLRASPDGLRTTSAFRTVLLSTGETPITSFGTDTGAAARVLGVRGFPFAAEDSRSVADHLNAATLEVYGSCGPAAVAWLAQNRERWPRIQKRWAMFRDAFAQKASSAFGGRAAPYVVTLRVAAELAQASAGLAVHAGALAQLERFALESAQVAERHRSALQDLWGWLASRPDAHDGPHERASREVVVRWHDERPSIIAVALRSWLAREGYQLDVVEEWARLGWIDTTGDRRTHSVRFQSSGTRARCYVFTDAALRELEQMGDPAPDA